MAILPLNSCGFLSPHTYADVGKAPEAGHKHKHRTVPEGGHKHRPRRVPQAGHKHKPRRVPQAGQTQTQTS